MRAVADEASDAIAKHSKYMGWQLGEGSPGAIVARGNLVRKDGPGNETVIGVLNDAHAGIAYRSTYTSSRTGRSTNDGFTGTRFWYASDNGFTVPITSDRRYDLLAWDSIFMEGFSNLPASVKGHDRLGGTPVVIVRETPPKGPPFDLYVDPSSGELKRFSIDPDHFPEVVDIDGYADFAPGKRFISGYHYEGTRYFYRYNDIAAKASLPPEDLAPPPQSAHWTFAKGGHIPINVTDSRIYIDAAIDGVQGHFILDTGSSQIALSDKFADRIHFKRADSATFGGIAGAIRGSYGEVQQIVLADGSKLENVTVSSGLDLGPEADGLIGFDFLAGAIVDMDLDASQITLYDPKVFAPDERSGLVALADLDAGIPVIPVKLNGSTSAHALLDSGASGDVLLSHEFIGHLKMLIDDSRLASLEFVGGIGGYEADRCGTLDNVILGSITYQSPRACYSFSFDRDHALVGIHFMKHFNITFDYPDAKLVLTPRK